ncbi:MAG: hypothetical protein FWH19_01325 [Treponema sp.]|nr:hypothetical protein [Treponema sp.]
MRKICLFIVSSLMAFSVFAQTREDTAIFIPTVSAARPDHAAFFKENFDMETVAAGYSLADNANSADFTLRLDVSPNMITYDDGFQEQAPPDEPQFLLRVTLVRNEDGFEMVSFSFPFTELEEMYDFNLFLLYQAMANVPITRLGEVIAETDRWRNKWLYVRGSFDYPVIANHIHVGDEIYGRSIYNPLNPLIENQELDNITAVGLGVTIGLELQFLYWMSAEANFVFRFGEPHDQNAFIPGLGLQLKFPLKPANHFMLEPYIMGVSQINTSNTKFPLWAAGGGMQFGVKGGEIGAFFIDANFLYSFDYVETPNPMQDWLPSNIYYTRMVVSIGIGYKIGFMDRRR